MNWTRGSTSLRNSISWHRRPVAIVATGASLTRLERLEAKTVGAVAGSDIEDDLFVTITYRRDQVATRLDRYPERRDPVR
jgi:hypothetical protein